MTSLLLEHRRRVLLSDLVDGSERLPLQIGLMLAAIVVCGAAYGAVLGAWHGARLSMYVAAKVPILLIATAVLTSFFNFVAASLLGVTLSFRQVFAMTLFPLAIAAVIAASVAPPLLLFAVALPLPSPRQQTLHNLLYLVHVAVIAGAGYAGASFLRDALRSPKVLFTWIALYAFVGGEIAWILRPFVGSVYLPVAFIRDDALRGNVYEFIVTDIVPHLWRQL